MSRRKAAVKREILPDPKYGSVMLSKFINSVMSDGKKVSAERICYEALDIVKEKTGEDPIKAFKTAVDNVKPVLEVNVEHPIPIEINRILEI